MKKIILLILSLLVATSLAYAKSEELVRDSGNKGTPIQGAAWNGAKAVALTVASTTIDFTDDIAYSVYSTVDCWERWMPLSTSTKANYVKTPILGGQWQSAVVKQKTSSASGTPFGNFSGCTGGYLKRQ